MQSAAALWASPWGWAGGGVGWGVAPGWGTDVAVGGGAAVGVADGVGTVTVPVHVGRPRRETSLVRTFSRLAGTQPVKSLSLSARSLRLLREFRVSGI